jgi:hypothetical protein
VLALLPHETGEQCGGRHHIETGRRELPLSISLQCRISIHKPLSVKHFHGVSGGNVHECSMKSRVGKAS